MRRFDDLMVASVSGRRSGGGMLIGANAIHFAPRATEFIGVDISAESLDECERQIRRVSDVAWRPSPGGRLGRNSADRVKRHGDQTAGTVEGEAASGCERMQAVRGEFVERHVVADVVRLGGFGEQVPDELV